ncbi:hypothetical protein K458DRAFT_393349 [Lentithecium fluviatile CBS 122367]|uniref:Uncharacterized protein n=1 Tax=Lentithecium fluviatile CBS 122367 TaxID=1168545 RepID=A0A6G1IPA6_9PLEO|nr:hypothetical protein K458DRAFT_393349 [Lentithecium fluviatile CBS 122367]
MHFHVKEAHLVEMIPTSAYGTCLVLGLIFLSLYIFEKYVSYNFRTIMVENADTETRQNSLRYQVAKALAQRIGYFRNLRGTRMKELTLNSRFLRFSNGHGMSEQGTAIAGDEPYIT